MKFLSMLAIVLTLGMTLASVDAEAKRLGGGRSSGMQRQMTTPNQQAQTPFATNPNTRQPAAVPQAQPKRSWLGPLAGLAAGIGLAALASHFGFGQELASMMMIGLLVMAVLMVIGFIMRRRAAAQQPAMAGMNRYQNMSSNVEYMPAAQKSYNQDYNSTTPIGGSASYNAAPSAIPAGFDVEGFVRSAKVHFIRLQAANDSGNLDDIREFTTPEMFAEIKMDISDRKGAHQETDVVNIDAEVIEVIDESSRQVASVRFTGLIREDKHSPAEPINEIWHLVKPRAGNCGWLLAGIQQAN
ncbi:Tim44 domain-containing protein [Leeia oryzae]|uniref:Tim44 domain-containing protein n=1 Tax=Leeia oryzae TaxID=356662 RepID=UPI00037FF811|nr:TIM44-like domain-containing protein [Leeia oryzae]